jgi:hypothetical protein
MFSSALVLFPGRTMTKPVGRWLPVSPFRRVVTDLMMLSRAVPSVCADRRMDLSPLMAARQRCASRPSWCVLFSKAYALLGRDYPVVRQAYMKFPWPHLYEHPHHVVALNIERQLGEENIVLFCLIRAPENRSIAEMDAIVRHHKEAPLDTLRSFQRMRALGRVPWPWRRWFWWSALNVFGGQRCHHFGTFGITSIAAQGAGLLRLIPLLTSTLHYSLFDERGRLDMRLSFDHRVMDGATAGRLLTDFEAILNREMVRELNGLLRVAA